MAYFGSDRDDKTVKKKNAKSKGEVIVSSIKNNRNKWIAGALAVVILIAAYSCAAGGRSGAGGGQESGSAAGMTGSAGNPSSADDGSLETGTVETGSLESDFEERGSGGQGTVGTGSSGQNTGENGEGSADSNPGGGAYSGTGTGADTGTGSDTGPGTSSGAGADSGSDTDSGIGVDSGTSIASGDGTDSGTGKDSGTGTGTGSEAGGSGTDDRMTSTQRNSINMLNYMAVLTQEINESKGNQMFLESANSALVNDLYPNAVDTRTQAQVQSLLDSIEGYRMIDVKRNRLEFIYEQNKAKALRKAVPNPVGLLSAVKSQDVLRTVLSVVYMAADSVTSYNTASSQTDLQYIKEGWELDDAEAAELHDSTKSELSYMFNMVRDYSLPGDYALNQESVENFVSWVKNPNVVRRIAWLETNEKTYSQFGPYWLRLAEAYYETGDYSKCLEAFGRYEAIATRIFRKDLDYARALPMAIISAAECREESEYIEIAENYCELILSNTKDSDWGLRYFVAQTYLDLYAKTDRDSYLDAAYKIEFDNVNILVDEQKELNTVYLLDVVDVKAEKDATKREKKEIKQYNKMRKEERKTALPPVSEALYLNCEMLFALAEEKNISEAEQKKIDAILHENGEPIFLAGTLDDKFRFDHSETEINPDEIAVEFDGKSLTIPAVCMTDRSTVTLEISGPDGKETIEDWTVTSVKRPEGAECADYKVKIKSQAAGKHKYKAGEKLVIRIITVDGKTEDYTAFNYKVVSKKKFLFVNGIGFERITE